VGVPSSAASYAAGQDLAPAALRSAGLLDQLIASGLEERMFIAQPTLSQQIRRLEQMVGTPLLQRRRDGVRLTAAGTMLLAAARDVLSVRPVKGGEFR